MNTIFKILIFSSYRSDYLNYFDSDSIQTETSDTMQPYFGDYVDNVSQPKIPVTEESDEQLNSEMQYKVIFYNEQQTQLESYCLNAMYSKFLILEML